MYEFSRGYSKPEYATHIAIHPMVEPTGLYYRKKPNNPGEWEFFMSYGEWVDSCSVLRMIPDFANPDRPRLLDMSTGLFEGPDGPHSPDPAPTVPQGPSNRILKYRLKFGENFTVELPVDSQVIRVGTQEDEPFIWVLTSDAETTQTFTFKSAKTGGELGDLEDFVFIGMAPVYVQMELMLHYFMLVD